MSALAPKADMCGAAGDVRYGPKADIAVSFDYVVGNSHHARGNRNAKCLSGLEVDRQFVLSRLHNRQIGRLLTFENSSDVDAYLAIRLRYPVAVRHQTTGLGEFWKIVDRWYPIMGCQRDNLTAPPK